MKEHLLPREHHVVRYAGLKNLEGKEASPDAFLLRPDEKNISVNWLEYYANLGKKEQLAEIRKVSRLNLGRNGRYAELNVGTIYDHLAEEIKTLKIFHSPLDEDGEHEADPSHSEIAELPSNGSDEALMVAAIIAYKCVLDHHPALEGQDS